MKLINMQNINVIIQPTDTDFEIFEGLPAAYGITDATLFVTFIYKKIQFTAWIAKTEMKVEMRGVGRQLVQYAKMRSSRERSQ